MDFIQRAYVAILVGLLLGAAGAFLIVNGPHTGGREDLDVMEYEVMYASSGEECTKILWNEKEGYALNGS